MLMYIPLLMVKDFGAGGWSTDTAFMTNADTPVLAMEGLIADPVNPFTGNPITSEPKYAPELHILNCQHNIEINNGTVFDPKDSVWITLRNGDALDLDNWEIVNEPPKKTD